MRAYQFSRINEWIYYNIHNKVIYLNGPYNFNDSTENNFSLKSLEECRGGKFLKKSLIDNIYSSIGKEALNNKNLVSPNDSGKARIKNNHIDDYDVESLLDKYSERLYKKLKGRNVENFCHEVVRNAQMEYRVASLTKSNSNALMWGHYADGMRGVCIEYSIDSKDIDEVLYEDCYAVDVMEIMAGGAGDEVRKTFLRKSKDWSYEKEYRIVKVGDCFYSLNGDQLKSIYFGYRCDPDKAGFIRDLVVNQYGSDVKFYVTRNSFTSYLVKNVRIDPDGLKDKIKEIKGSENNVKEFLIDSVHDKIFDAQLRSGKQGI